MSLLMGSSVFSSLPWPLEYFSSYLGTWTCLLFSRCLVMESPNSLASYFPLETVLVLSSSVALMATSSLNDLVMVIFSCLH